MSEWRRKKRHQAILHEFLETNSITNFRLFQQNENMMKMVRMLQKILANQIMTDIMLFYAKYLAFVFQGCDYFTVFMKPLALNLLNLIETVITSSISDSLHSTTIAFFNSACVNFSKFLQDWYKFQKMYCAMNADLCVIAAKMCKDYIYVAVQYKRENRSSVFTKYASDLQDIIQDLVEEMCLAEEQIETKKKVDTVFEKYTGSDVGFIRAMQDQLDMGSRLPIDFSANLDYIKGLVAELHMVRDGKVVALEEIQFLQRVLSRI